VLRLSQNPSCPRCIGAYKGCTNAALRLHCTLQLFAEVEGFPSSLEDLVGAILEDAIVREA
jgi:hypothetical protein